MTETSIQTLNQIINNITLYVPYFTIIAGVFGGCCNLLTFTSRQLRSNPCALYFLCSTIFDLIYLMFSAVTRLISDHYPYVLPQSDFFCKVRTYLSLLTPALATFFITLASTDRCWLTSRSRKWRDLSRLKVAKYIIVIAIIFWILGLSHILIFYEYRLRDINSTIYICVPKAGFYAIFLAFLLVCDTFLLYIIMFISSVITLIHIRTSRNRIRPLVNQRAGLRHIDRPLITMMFFQVGVGILVSLFRSIYIAYSFLTSNISKDLYRTTIESFLDQLSLMIYYMNFAKSFPVNTLTSPLFRNIFCQRIISMWKFCKRDNQVAIIQNTHAHD